MVGNDVVDLREPEVRGATRHPRFDARVFSDAERALVQTWSDDGDGDRVRWVLWAAKESAYKVARKEDPRTVFAPSRFVVHWNGAEHATVTHGRRRFQVDIATHEDFVHAVARAQRRERCVAAVTRADGSGASARRFAIVTLARLTGIAATDLAIGRSGRVPTLWVRGRRSAADLSLSHHGRFVAFACTPPTGWWPC